MASYDTESLRQELIGVGRKTLMECMESLYSEDSSEEFPGYTDEKRRDAMELVYYGCFVSKNDPRYGSELKKDPTYVFRLLEDLCGRFLFLEAEGQIPQDEESSLDKTPYWTAETEFCEPPIEFEYPNLPTVTERMDEIIQRRIDRENAAEHGIPVEHDRNYPRTVPPVNLAKFLSDRNVTTTE